MKMYELVAFNDFYTKIANATMPMTTAYRINKIIQEIKTDLEFYQSELKKIFDDCVEQENGQYKMTADNQNYVIKKDKIEDFTQRFEDLQKLDVKFDENWKINIDDLNLDITPQELLNITNFLK